MEHGDHFRFGFAHAAADGKTIERVLSEGRTALFAKLRINAAVDDSIHGLVLRVFQMLVERALFPAMRPIERSFELLRVDMIRRKLVERDDDISAEGFLRKNRTFWSEKDLGAISIRAEEDAVFIDFQNMAVLLFCAAAFQLARYRTVGERKHLKAAGVGDDRHFPVHELMKASGPTNDIDTGLK